MDQNTTIVQWEDGFSTGIKLIDDQHKELVNLTNELYQACLTGTDAVGPAFKEIMTRMVEYVRLHFSAEQEILNRIKYPNIHEHKSQHDFLVKQILEAAKEHSEGKKFVAHHFVRTLKDWIFGHIALYDKSYAAFLADQKSKGLLTDIH